VAAEGRWEVDPHQANTETDPDRKQALAVVHNMPLPCTEEDVAAVTGNLNRATVRRALIGLGEDRLRIRLQRSGDDARVIVTAVIHPQD